MAIIKSERGLDNWYWFQYRVLERYPSYIMGGALAAALAAWFFVDDVSVEAIVAAATGGAVVGAAGKWGKNSMAKAQYQRELREYETGGDRGGV